MSSLSSGTIIKLQKDKDDSNLFNSTKSLFNSKLFIDLDINEQEYNINAYSENNTKEDSDNSFEFEEMNYLSNELIKDLDLLSSISNDNEKINEKYYNNANNTINNSAIIDSLLSLAKDGYELKPKNYKPVQNENKPNNFVNVSFVNNINNNGLYVKNINYKRDKKNDWICSYCNNLNFSFRKKCNKCKISKENSNKYKNNMNRDK